MTNQIIDTVLSLWKTGRRTKVTPTGWISGNAPCCRHRGERPDTRDRGGILVTGDAFIYHCFNCSFGAGWQPGKLFSNHTKLLLKWLGLSDYDIGKLGLLALKFKNDLQERSFVSPVLNFSLVEKQLPENCKSFNSWFQENCTDSRFLDAVNHLTKTRGFGLDWYPWHWTPEPGYSDRIIIPYYQDNAIIGWAGRKITPGKPKYITESQPGYVFNIDRQSYDRKFVIVVEGILDAIAIDGVASLGDSLNETQCARITRLNRQVILVPDRDRPGAHLLKHAEEHKWNVSLPPWENDIKDTADAVKRYGRLYTLSTILHYQVHGEIKINLIRKYLEKLDV